GLAVCAVDGQGLAAALAYRRVMNGVGIDELEIEAPKSAVPVRRGVPRVAPGGSLPAPAPVAVRIDESGVPLEVVAAPTAGRLTPAVLATAKLRVKWDPAARRAQVIGRCRARADRHSVLFRVCEQAELRNAAEVARRHVQGHVAPELWYPQSPPLNVHVLPAVRLDVRVRDVVRMHLALSGDFAPGHGGA